MPLHRSNSYKNEEITFIHAFDFIAQCVYENARAHGFWDGDRNDGETIALIHSELSEALEGLRHGDPSDSHCPQFTSSEVEFADAIIRIMDHAAGRGINVSGAIIAKILYNQSRPFKHGKAF